MRSEYLTEIQKRIGYRFSDVAILETAFTHSSYANEHGCEDNERMEFLGDSVLNFIVARELYLSGQNEGAMTEERKRMVSREPLALAVEHLGIFEYLRMGEGAKKEVALSVKFKSNLFEAVVGAIYIDSGSVEECERFINSHLKAYTANRRDYKSELQEYVQSKKLGAIIYKTELKDNSKKPEFVSDVSVSSAVVGRGFGFGKKEAEKNAAKKALEFLKVKPMK